MEAGIESIEAHARRSRADELLERLAERVGTAARASTVFGEPVARDEVTVIPVAKARFGFGGGGGRDESEGEEGAGGGGGVLVSPVGYIELRAGGTRFRRIVAPADVLAVAAAGVALAFALARLAEALRAE